MLRLQLRHLRQIKFLYPEAFDWQPLKLAATPARNGGSTAAAVATDLPTLLLSLSDCTVLDLRGKSVRLSSVQHTQRLQEALQRFADSHKVRSCAFARFVAFQKDLFWVHCANPSKARGMLLDPQPEKRVDFFPFHYSHHISMT